MSEVPVPQVPAVAAGEDEVAHGVDVEQVPAPDTSPLARIRAERAARRAEQAAGRHVDLLVPDQGGVFVRFRPVDYPEQKRLNKAHEKAPASEREIRVAEATLGAACLGVGIQLEDGTKVSLDDAAPGGEWPRFDARTAALLEITPAPAKTTDVVRAVYLEDAAVLMTCTRLLAWSGYDLDAIEEAEQGN